MTTAAGNTAPAGPGADADAQRARQRVVRRPWRIVFMLYALALIIATHWPKLEMPAASPASDKTTHLLAFAIFTALLWQTAWVRSRLAVTLLGVGWSLLDEWTQGLPGVNRWMTLEDATANVLGALTVGAWLWALAPVGSRPNRMRAAVSRAVFEDIFSCPRRWMALATVAAVGANVAAFAWWLLDPADARRTIAAVALLCAAVVVAIAAVRWPRALRAFRDERRCTGCGSSADGTRFDAAGWGECARCGAAVYAGQWRPMPPPPARQAARFMSLPILIGAMCLAAAFALLWIMPAVHEWALSAGDRAAWIRRATRAVAGMPRPLLNVFDLVAFALSAALLVRLYRVRLARHYDQSERCRRCGHDVRATPHDERGRGICGECGTPFSRGA